MIGLEVKGLANPVTRVISVLESFSSLEPELSAADIHRRTGISKATLHRILTTLTQKRLLEKNHKMGTYSIGPELYIIGSLYLSTTDILKAAEPVLQELNNLTKEAISLSILDKDYNTIIMNKEAKSMVRFSVNIGTKTPAYASSMGKAMLSELSNEEIDAQYPEENLRKMAQNTIATRTELKKALEKIRKTGISFGCGEGHEGLCGIASVIRDVSGEAIAAVGFTVPSGKINQTTAEIFATLVKMGTGLISSKLGYLDTVKPVSNIEEIREWYRNKK